MRLRQAWRGPFVSFCATLLLATGVTAASFPHEAYVWQRAWRPAVSEAVTVAAPHLAGFAVLVSEIEPTGVVRVSPDYRVLAATGKPICFVVRIGPHAPTNAVPALAARWLADAASNDLAVTELQLDYDCPESKLDAYRQLLVAVRRETAPTPLTITALPTWLKHAAFTDLAAATDGFVLQVHSLDASLDLCDAAEARIAVARASRFGRPFRVALPTYGYAVGVDPEGTLHGVLAEGPSRTWPTGVVLREIHSDPAELAGLVRGWSEEPPSNLTGFLWYRLPVADDQMNWRWTTLDAVVAGRVPRPMLALTVRQPKPGLVELELANQGEADAAAGISIVVAWRDAALLASDALAGFSQADVATDARALRFAGIPRLAPAERRIVGWLRFRDAKEVDCEARLE
jgi:hypothetical protein